MFLAIIIIGAVPLIIMGIIFGIYLYFNRS